MWVAHNSTYWRSDFILRNLKFWFRDLGLECHWSLSFLTFSTILCSDISTCMSLYVSVCASSLQLNRQNRSLKRKSMMMLSHLSPETITQINLEDEEEEDGEDLNAASKVCLSPQCHATVSGTWCLQLLQVTVYCIHSSSHIETAKRLEAFIFYCCSNSDLNRKGFFRVWHFIIPILLQPVTIHGP